jgi:hypothetical protein
MARSASPRRPRISVPSSRMRPASASSSRSSRRPSVLLPQPLSPTMASVSPRATVQVDAIHRAQRTAAAQRVDAVQALGTQQGGGHASLRRQGFHRCAPAGDVVAGADGAQRRHRLALRGGEGAAGGEAAAGQRVGRRGHAAGDGFQPLLRAGERRHRRQQRQRVGVLRIGEKGAAGARSTMRPAYITATSSAISATTPRLWVMNRMPVPCRSRSVASRERICAWMVTSSAVVGSSAISSAGSQASAMAIITRWRMPPESSCG